MTIAGKHAVVVGRSNIVGLPVALMLLHANATVTPSPATHTFLTQLKARETVCQTLLYPKECFHTEYNLSDSVPDTFCTKNSV